MKQVLSFLSNLQSNNDREWFNTHKDEFEVAKKRFEGVCEELIANIATFDKDFSKLDVKDCVFRIYRDIRFSHDKTPYKTHFGAYMAYPGGRKSARGGYYLHIEPNGKSFFAAGVWSPQPPVLKALRQSVCEHYDEFEEILDEPDFKKLFGDSFYEEDKLKKIPAGFPTDFKNPELLKLKHYIVSHDLRGSELENPNFTKLIAGYAEKARPLNLFLNFTIDEITA